MYVCHTTAATASPAAEESCVSDPNPSSATQDAAVPKAESLEPNKEMQPAHSRSQESGESPPLAKQQRTGTRSRSGVQLAAASLAIQLTLHFIPCCWAAHPSSSVSLSLLVAANCTLPFSPCPFALLGLRVATLICFLSLYICNFIVRFPFVLEAASLIRFKVIWTDLLPLFLLIGLEEASKLCFWINYNEHGVLHPWQTWDNMEVIVGVPVL